MEKIPIQDVPNTEKKPESIGDLSTLENETPFEGSEKRPTDTLLD